MRPVVPFLTITAAVIALGCSPDSPVEPPPSPACAPGAAATDLTDLARYEGRTVAGASLACVILAPNARYLVMPQFATTAMPYAYYPYAIGLPGAPVVARGEVAARAVRSSVIDPVLPGPVHPADRLHDRLREAEARLRPDRSVRGAVRARAEGALAFATPAPALGTSRDFSILAGLTEPATFARATASLRFAGSHVLLYLDERASGSFTASELTALGRQFDEVLYPIDREAFGPESDVDGNGRIIVVLSPAVNALVRADECASFGYVTGYFFGFDLASTAPGSNRGEVFYAMTPDPGGVHSCAHSAADVARVLPATFVHELQHMISFARRVLEADGAPEVAWLNEGLSHLAEELAARYYESKYPAPAGRTAPGQLFPDSASALMLGNLRNSYRFLVAPRQHAVAACAPSSFCSTANRGASWLFLRWLADRHGDAAIRAMVQTGTRDARNIEQATGRSFPELFGDFVLATWSDSIVGASRGAVAERHRFATRNLRQMYNALYEAYGPLGGIPRPFPLEPLELRADERLQSAMHPGTFDIFAIRTPSGVARLPIGFTDESGALLSPLLSPQLAIMRLD